MSYDSDPNRNPNQPGDTGANQSGSQPQNNHDGSWLLDGQDPSQAPQQPVEPVPAQGMDQAPIDDPVQAWGMEGEPQPAASTAPVGPDGTDETWLAQMGEGSQGAYEEEGQGAGALSASYCEPESPTTILSRLLVPSVFVAALSVGGMVLWNSMGKSKHKPSHSTEGIVADAGEVDNSTRLKSLDLGEDAKTDRPLRAMRGQIQRDGSVQTPVRDSSADNHQNHAHSNPGSGSYTPSSGTNASSKTNTAGFAEWSSAEQELHNASNGVLVPESEAQHSIAQDTDSQEIEEQATDGIQNVDGAEALSDSGWAPEMDTELGMVLYGQLQPMPLLSIPIWGPAGPAPESWEEDYQETVDEHIVADDTESMNPLEGSDDSNDAQGEALAALEFSGDLDELPFVWVDEEETSSEAIAIAVPELESTEQVSIVDMEEVAAGSEDWSGSFDETASVDPTEFDLGTTEISDVTSDTDAQGQNSEQFEGWELPNFDDIDGEGSMELAGEGTQGTEDSQDVTMVLPWSGLEVQTSDQVEGPAELDEFAEMDSGMDANMDTDLDADMDADMEWTNAMDWPVDSGSVDEPMEQNMGDLTDENPIEDFTELASDISADDSIEIPVNTGEEDSAQDTEDMIVRDWYLGTNAEDEFSPLADNYYDLDWEQSDQPVSDQVVLIPLDVEMTEGSEYTNDNEMETDEWSSGDTPEFIVDEAMVQSGDSTDLTEEVSDPSSMEVALDAEMPTEELATDNQTSQDAELSAEQIAEDSTELIEELEQELAAVETDAAQALEISEDPTEGTDLTTTPVVPEHLEVTVVATELDSAWETMPQEPDDRDLLDLYGDWSLMDDQGQVQEVSLYDWMGMPAAGQSGMPFHMAQQSESMGTNRTEQQPAEVEPEAEKAPTRPKGILRRRTQEGGHWAGTKVPMHALSGEIVLLTPNVGPVRVIALEGETIEGRLHGMGQGYVWLENNLGRMTVPARRVERIDRIDPAQYRPDRKSVMDFTRLPKVRVKAKGGVFVGHELAREGNRITIRTDSGAKLTLVSDQITPAGSFKAVGLKRKK